MCVLLGSVTYLLLPHYERKHVARIYTFKRVYQLYGCLGIHVTLSEKIPVPIYREDVKQYVPFNIAVQRAMHGVIFQRILL